MIFAYPRIQQMANHQESTINDAEGYVIALKKRYLDFYTSHSYYLTEDSIPLPESQLTPLPEARVKSTACSSSASVEAGSCRDSNRSNRDSNISAGSSRRTRRKSYELMVALNGGRSEQGTLDKRRTPWLSPGEVRVTKGVITPCGGAVRGESPGVVITTPHPPEVLPDPDKLFPDPDKLLPDSDDRASPVSFTTSPPRHLDIVSPAPSSESNKRVPPKTAVKRRGLPDITLCPSLETPLSSDGSTVKLSDSTPCDSVFNSPEPVQNTGRYPVYVNCKRSYLSPNLGYSALDYLRLPSKPFPKRGPAPFSQVKYTEAMSDFPKLMELDEKAVIRNYKGKENLRSGARSRPVSAYEFFKKSHIVENVGNCQRSKSTDFPRKNQLKRPINRKSNDMSNHHQMKRQIPLKPNKFKRTWASSSDYNTIPPKDRSLTRSKSCCSSRTSKVSSGSEGARNYRGRESKHKVFRMDKDCQLLFPNFTDFSPYVGSLTVRRDKRRRPDIRKETGLFSPRRAENSSLLSPKRDPNLSSSANSLESHPLKRSNTICTSGDVQAYLRSKCNREFAASRDGSDSMSFKRHSKSTFDSGFESGLSDILDEILGGGQYDPVLEESMPKTKWQSFKGKLTEAFHKSKRNELNDAMSDNSDIKSTKWDKVSQFVKVKIAKVSNQDLDMGGFEDNQWRSLEPRQFHRGTRRTQSFVKWNRARER
ncbi:uncharacterized protein LOC134819244 isoform X1 [Bolinopsis microptera]|uniref:uncharacterized protein LOC134819244 isoform X1 n=1 Tax=Bolinopsis microptera TaxID=2820187 RepID=UPI00307992E1